MARGHIHQRTNGTFRVLVYAGEDPLGTLGGLSLIVPLAVRTAVGEEAVAAGVVIAVLRR